MRPFRPASWFAVVCAACIFCAASWGWAADANRLNYLDESDPYYVSRTFPKLVTPQWVGERGVDAVIILAIDDMRDPAVYEKVLTPAIERLKKIDGKAPISIMTCKVNPADPRLQTFLAEGLSLEVHTIDHPCPILAGGNFAKAKQTYDGCVDLMDAIPGNHSVAFRTPCCDSKNTLSPRLLAEIFNATTPKGNFLEADSSVFHRFTADDPALPRELVMDDQARDRYARYVPFPSFANSIRDYPYPYVIGSLCWEFPCITPSDWESFNIQGKANPQLLKDWEAQLDATVIKQGTFTLVFHPYGWSSPQQIAQLVDYADAKYGKRVKFLTFRDAVERMNQNVLGGQHLRAANGQDNGVRLLDLNNDGYLDVVIGNDRVRQTRVWDPKAQTWAAQEFPAQIVRADAKANQLDGGVRFGIVRDDGAASFIVNRGEQAGAWSFVDSQWAEEPSLRTLLQSDGSILTAKDGIDQGVRLRDLDHGGRCELIVSNPQHQAIYGWDAGKQTWSKLPFTLPKDTTLVDAQGRDAGLRFVDVDQDGYDDVIFSNDQRYSLHLFSTMQDGWSRKVSAGVRTPGDQSQIPPIVRNGANNGVWFLRNTMWVQNEDTATLPDVVDRRAFNELVAKIDPGPRSPEASLHSIQTRPGFATQLMAKEPVVEDPIAFAWGPDGRFWVVEMGDYPLGVDGKGKPGGRVLILESTHNDGVYDKSTVFLDHLPFPTGVMPWGNGVLVTDAPEVFYAEDTRRDGHCDLRKTLYAGFVEGNQQHRVNGLLYGLDNWVHGANGNSGGNVRSLKTGTTVSISGRDFRIKPDEDLIETETGQAQYGHTMTDWGDWFGCDNTNPMYQYVLEDHYLRRNRYFSPPNGRVQTSDTPGASAVYPTSRTLPRFNDPWGANHFTSACGVIVYRDDLFGPAFIGNSFVSEPVHDLVHREIMRREGIVYHSRRPDDEKESEFWASSDNWTRPTMIRVGPDGALWIADMYRYVIEHPEWIPKDWQARLDLRAGHDRGRIYRVFPVGVSPRPIPRLDQLSLPQLVRALDSPSGWQRDLVQQMLVQRQDKAAVPLLERLARESKWPVARLHALCTLDGLNALDGELLLTSLKDPEGGVRRHAIRLCEGRFQQSPQIGEMLTTMVSDPDPQVRLQLGYTLGEWDDPHAGQALAELLTRDAADPYITAAALSSVSSKNLDAVVSAVAGTAGHGALPSAALADLLKMSSAMGNDKATAHLLNAVALPQAARSTTAQFNTIAAALSALDSVGTPLSKLADSKEPELERSVRMFEDTFQSARSIANSAKASPDERAAAIGLLGYDAHHLSDDLQLLASLLSPRVPDSLQQAAIASLGHMHDPNSPRVLLAGWKSFSPAMRSRVLDVLLAHRQSLPAVLDAIEHKQILSSDIDAPHRHRLLQTADSSLRQRARTLLAETIKPDRQAVIESFKSVLTLEGSAERGHATFSRVCTVCHQLKGEGNAIGPDLAGVGDKSAEGLMISILDPNRAVEPQYVNYVAETRDGQTISGILRRESGNSVTMAMPNGIEQTILRGDLKSLRSTGLSLMPEGLEAGLSPQDLADLIAYVQDAGPRPQRRSFEGNRPEPVLPAADGKIELLPSNCEIFGSKITLEKQYGNLGYWMADDDHAVWTIQPARAGKYAVYLHYACDNTDAGNTLLLTCGTDRIAIKVEGTGNWDTYRKIKVGEMTLSAARQRFTAKPEGKIHGALLDLRAIELVAEK